MPNRSDKQENPQSMGIVVGAEGGHKSLLRQQVPSWMGEEGPLGTRGAGLGPAGSGKDLLAIERIKAHSGTLEQLPFFFQIN